jgi:hypothetical protein
MVAEARPRYLHSGIDEDGDPRDHRGARAVVRELHVAPEQTVQEGDLIAIIDEN